MIISNFIDRRGIVTPEYRAEQERISSDNVITNNKTYGTVKIIQPQVFKYLLMFLYFIYIIIYILFFFILLQSNGTTVQTNPSPDLTGSINNLVSDQHSSQIESINGELNLLRHTTHYPEDLSKYSQEYIDDTYVPAYPRQYCFQDSIKHVKYDTEIENPDFQRYPCRCEENLHKYSHKCREEYHRCSDNNLIYDQCVSDQKYGIDLQKYPKRYSEDSVQYKINDKSIYTDLQKFPQCYSEDPLRISQSHTLKYNNLRCTVHGLKYPISKNLLPTVVMSRILGAGGMPIIGQNAIGLAVNRFGSEPLTNAFSYTENSLCPNDSTEEDLLNQRFIMSSISDNDDI